MFLHFRRDGILTDSLGNQVDFRNTLVIMASNLGTRFLATKGHMGFREKTSEGDQKSVEQMINQELKKEFSPEFINRRAIQRHIEDELSEFMVRHKDNVPERIDFTMNGDQVALIAAPKDVDLIAN